MAAPNTDYSKFTVPQLKARCKELKIAGYSKLGKAALLEKLSQHENPIAATSSQDATVSATAGKAVISPCESRLEPCPSLQHDSVSRPVPSSGNWNSAKAPDTPNLPSHVPVASPTTTSKTSAATESGKTPAQILATNKRLIGSVAPTLMSSQKKLKLAKNTSTVDSENSLSRSGQAKAVVGKPAGKTSTPQPSPLVNRLINGPGVFNQLETNIPTRRPGKPVPQFSPFRPPSSTATVSLTRFRPLVPSQKNLQKTRSSGTSTTDQVSKKTLLYLDFGSAPLLPPPSTFQYITIPPSLAQRKRVNAWSVILSGLSDSERRTCSLVSRGIRYAVYLSAIPIMNRVFGTRRLALLSGKYSMAMTNFWPYLKQLRLELANTQMAYFKSFLAEFFGSHMPIADALWGCPDNERQLVVALRFLITRIWFAISLNGNDIERTKNFTVIDAQEVVKGEIWSITILTNSAPRTKTTLETFYVLEPTCEVIGLPPPVRNPVSTSRKPIFSSSAISRTLCLRVDWSDYIQHRISTSEESCRISLLMDYLKTTNEEEYTKGISKLWLARASKEGEVGQYKKKVADRYILACVVQNSVSGQWMSSAHMAQVFAGTASESDVHRTPLSQKECRRVNLFLPAHHLVESVHFTTSGPKAQSLHPALAIVQTPSREYFILRDNGMEVGCEEDDGVWPVWTELLGCDSRGVARS